MPCTKRKASGMRRAGRENGSRRQPRWRNREIHVSLANAGIDIGFRNGNLRFSLHLYNTLDEVQHATEILKSTA